jgi:hypothetical protein
MPGPNRDVIWAKTGYEPHNLQWLYHNSSARFRVPCCGRRFGKSTMAAHDLEPKMFIPRQFFWIVGPTYDLGEKEFRPLWDDLIVKLQLGKNKKVKKSYNKRTGEMFIEMPWQTRLEVRSASHPETLVGEGLDHAIMSEAAKHHLETWERFIRPSLSDRRGSADFPTTPEGHNWLYQMWLLGQDKSADLVDYDSWRFPSWDNPFVYPGGRQDPEILLLEKTTTPEWFMQEIGADFASFVGKIYDEWDDTVHIRNHVYNPAWQNYIAFDWGFVNPLAAIEFQIDPFDNIYVWREHYESYTPLAEHLRLLRNREQPAGYKIDCCFGDAADPEASEFVSSNFGVGCVADPDAKTNWREGIELVKSFLKEYQIGEADEYGTPLCKPKLTVDPACKNTIREFNNYRAMEGRSGKNPREIAQGVDDHCLDALRYGIVHIYKLGARHHLAEVAGMMNLTGVGASHRDTFFSMEDQY